MYPVRLQWIKDVCVITSKIVYFRMLEYIDKAKYNENANNYDQINYRLNDSIYKVLFSYCKIVRTLSRISLKVDVSGFSLSKSFFISANTLDVRPLM